MTPISSIWAGETALGVRKDAKVPGTSFPPTGRGYSFMEICEVSLWEFLYSFVHSLKRHSLKPSIVVHAYISARRQR
jgi:hypothetical protein